MRYLLILSNFDKMNKIYLTILFVLVQNLIFAQTTKRTCGTMDLLAEMQQKDSTLQIKIDDFNKRIAQRIQSKATNKTAEDNSLFLIPVVVHVIHNGENIGEGMNISDEQIFSQIESLNKDFRLLNEDSLDENHPFWGYTADCKIEFCLAKQDEYGNPTNGITRVYGEVNDWTRDEIDEYVKPQTIWNPNKYLNIWTLAFGGDDSNVLGYANFPFNATDTTDGVVVAFDKFGVFGNVSYPYDLGRTATHEIGHYFDLFHIWGDEDCGDDEVADTEASEKANDGCPEFPHNAYSSCGSGENGEMYMNYMDYSDDACLNMFTFGQKERMRTAIQLERFGLLLSDGCAIPSSVSYIEPRKEVKVFPTPSNDNVFIEMPNFEEIQTFRLYSITGADLTTLITSKQVSPHGLSLQLTDIASGYYIFEVSTSNQLFRGNIIVNR